MQWNLNSHHQGVIGAKEGNISISLHLHHRVHHIPLHTLKFGALHHETWSTAHSSMSPCAPLNTHSSLSGLLLESGSIKETIFSYFFIINIRALQRFESITEKRPQFPSIKPKSLFAGLPQAKVTA